MVMQIYSFNYHGPIHDKNYDYNHREVLQMSKFTIPTKIKVLYRPQGIIFIIRGEAEDNKNDPERPILHFYLSWYSKFTNFEHFEMIIIFYLLRPNFTNTGVDLRD